MEWLSPTIADRLQFITLPLELIGLLLAAIEVRFATLTQWLNVRLLGVHDAVVRSDDRWRTTHPKIARMTVWRRFHVPMPAWMHVVFMVLVVVAVVMAVILQVVRWIPDLDGAESIAREVLTDFFNWVYLPVMGAAALMTMSIRFIVSFAKDRAVGTLGLLIAGLGVLGEVYQFAVSVGT